MLPLSICSHMSRAFSVLSRLSQHKNVKLRELADHIVETRTVPKA